MSLRRGILATLLISVCLYALTWLAYTDTPVVKRLSQVIDGVQGSFSGFDVKSNDPKTADESIKVLLVAYFRSGSSFSAELLTHLNDSFYMFEPLHAYYRIYRPHFQMPLLLNGSIWWQMYDGYKQSYASHVLQSVLNCDFLSVDKPTLLTFAKHSQSLARFRLCIQEDMTVEDIRTICVRKLREECLQAPVRVIKTIRTPMELVGELVKKDPKVKVIHLLRDPRGQLRSWLSHAGGQGNTNHTVQSECSRLTNDIKYRKELEQKFPENFMEIIYESLSQFPQDILKRLYGWLNLSVQPSTIQWLQNKTENKEDGNFLETFRKNSTVTAYLWAKHVKFMFVKLVNQYCGYVIKHGYFPAIDIKSELTNFQIPQRYI